jgi:adenine-specific DNA-methyltransferase
MKLKVDSSEQKLRGGYYTPKLMADFIVKWALPPKKDSGNNALRILEPSCGDGVFLESLINTQNPNKFYCTAIELIENEANVAKERTFYNSDFNVINSDFFEEFNNTLKNQKFDIILGNPPYIRYQYLTTEQRDTQAKILVDNGMKSNKLINAWVSFVVAAVQMLDKNGKIGLVIPAELLQVAYAEELRLFLIENLSKVSIITFEELVFPDVQQEVVLLLGEKTEKKVREKNKITVIEVQNVNSLEEQFNNLTKEFKDVDHTSDKWTKYFLNNYEISLINEIKDHDKFLKFKEVADIDIGITTGNNKYFSVDNETVQKYNLQEVALPLIGRSAHASGLYFNYDDWQKNVDKGVAAQLVYFPNKSYDLLPQNYQEYIKLGEEQEMHIGYKCSIRENWFHIPSVWVPDAFFLRRNNKFPKFVLNDIDAVSTDTMHRIRFNQDIDRDKLLLSYYNSITFAFTEIEGRSYGGGVLEILPGELEKVVLPNLQDIDSSLASSLIQKIDQVIRDNVDIEVILDEIDQAVLVDYIGIEKEVVLQFRNIWKKLMNRRLNRKKRKNN